MNEQDLFHLAYLASVALFVIGLKQLARVRTARRGNTLLATGVLFASIITLVEEGMISPLWIVVGLAVGTAVALVMVARATATSMPQVVARFNGLGGAASTLVALALFWNEVMDATSGGDTAVQLLGVASAVTLAVSILIGAVTFSGSVIAELKLWGKLRGLTRIPGRTVLTVLALVLAIGASVIALIADSPTDAAFGILALTAVSAVLGVFAVAPVGGADMPVMISLLNSLSGLAVAATGFALDNTLLIMGGTIVGAAGMMLTLIMCTAMNRSLWNVLAGGLGSGATGDGDSESYENIVSSDAEEAAMVLEVSSSVIIVPGYGLAAARAQQAAADLTEALSAQNIEVRFAIHPVAGRMPGHMNVVLAEADVPYERLVEMDEINHEFASTDVVIVVGANDVVNPAANTDPSSPIAGMPILDVEKAQRVFVIKRSLAAGYAGIKNGLFERDNCTMLFGDAKAVLDDLTREIKANAPV